MLKALQIYYILTGVTVTTTSYQNQLDKRGGDFESNEVETRNQSRKETRHIKNDVLFKTNNNVYEISHVEGNKTKKAQKFSIKFEF